MAVTQYIGARYQPIFAEPSEWSSENTYEPLTIVQHEGNSFTSKQSVPVGIDINNEKYWAETGNYNAQIEQYRQDVTRYKSQTDSNIADLNRNISEFKTEVNSDIADLNRNISEFKTEVNSDIDMLKMHGVTVECNEREKWIETLVKIPKSAFTMEYIRMGDGLTAPTSFIECAQTKKHDIIMNIQNGTWGVFDGVVTGGNNTGTDGGYGGYYMKNYGDLNLAYVEGNSITTINDIYSRYGYQYIQPSGPKLITNGIRNVIGDYYVSGKGAVPSARQNLAWDDDYWYIYSVFGRIGNNKIGMTMQELQEEGIKRGWSDLCAFDGGGSVNTTFSNPPISLNAIIDSNQQVRKAYTCIAFDVRS